MITSKHKGFVPLLNMSKRKNLGLKQFLSLFPEIELPISLTGDTISIFSKQNKPISEEAIRQFILPMESEEIDELTEYVPCFRIPDTKNFHVIVYWKGGLMKYEYVLISLKTDGQLISRNVIAGILSDGDTVTQSVAHIDEDWIISIIVGQSGPDGKEFEASDSLPISMEILNSGEVIYSIQKQT